MDYPDPPNDSGIGEEDSASSLHPDKYDHEHISKLEVFTDDLQKAISSSFPPVATPYTSVHVLLLRWAEDDLNVLDELTTLKRVFENQFRFATEQWDIPSQNSTRALQTKLYDFQDAHQNENELLIVYYGGHGDADRRRGRSIWAAYNRADSPTVTWSSLQHLLENAVPHVLLILDCCYAANAARDTAVGTTKELLAACGRENPTTGVGRRSFTYALIEELQAFGAAPFTIAMLHGRLVTMRWRLAFTPIYALLSEHGGDSIQLCPLPLPLPLPTQAVQLQNVPGSFDGSSAPIDLPSEADSPLSTSRRQSASGTAADTRVLLAVSIAGDASFDVSRWKQWLVSQAPWDVTSVEVRVEAVFQSHSTMLVTSVPVPAWDELPDRAAYRFIGFVKPENHAWSGAPKVPQKGSIHDANLSVAEKRPRSRTRLSAFYSLGPSLFPTGPDLPRPSGSPGSFSSTFDPFDGSSGRSFELEDSTPVPSPPISPGSSAAGSAQNPAASSQQESKFLSVSPVPSMSSGWSSATLPSQNSAENPDQDPAVQILGQSLDQNPAQNSDQNPAWK